MPAIEQKRAFTYGGLSVFFITIILVFTTGTTFNRNHPSQPIPSLTVLIENMKSKQVNLDKQKNTFPEGIYYEYSGDSEAREEDSPEVKIAHPELILGYIAGRGADLKEAWFRSSGSSCSPPGSNMAMDVIVPAKLLIRVSQPLSDGQQQVLGLTRVESPSMSACPYYIRHYTFNSESR